MSLPNPRSEPRDTAQPPKIAPSFRNETLIASKIGHIPLTFSLIYVMAVHGVLTRRASLKKLRPPRFESVSGEPSLYCIHFWSSVGLELVVSSGRTMPKETGV